ncbi:hypothetical protein Fmac_021200 [Flemingia macrophylla]|uniref:Uncharacterized protein n=1 Tax=Flemingia macrophylla TaxID=520843 RepID=A0ABD1LW67_9FABA
MDEPHHSSQLSQPLIVTPLQHHKSRCVHGYNTTQARAKMDIDAIGDPVDKLKAIQNDDVEDQDEMMILMMMTKKRKNVNLLLLVLLISQRINGLFAINFSQAKLETNEAKLLLDSSRDLFESSPLGLREGKCQERMNVKMNALIVLHSEIILNCENSCFVGEDQHEQWKRRPENPSRRSMINLCETNI